jgi:multiple sugar transport system substrate-binding protein
MNRSIRLLVPLVALSLMAAACGPNREDNGGNGGNASAPAGSGAPMAGGGGSGELSASGDVFAYGVSYETSDEIAKGRVDHFRAKYPDVNVTFSESGFESQGFLTALQSDDPPDVVRIPRDRLGTYVSRGVIEPLDDCINRAGVDMGLFRDAAVQQVTIDGSVYAMPEFFWVTDWLIDNDLFQQAGLDPVNWDVSDWDAISQANKALLDKTDAKIAIDPKIWDNGDRFPLWVYANGGQMLSDDGKESKLDTPEVAEALTFTKSLIDDQGGIVDFKDKIGQTGDFFGAENEFANDLEAAFPMQQWYLNVLAGASPDTAITARAFETRDGDPITYAEGDGLAVVASSDNKDAACAFVTDMVSTDAWVAAAKLRQQRAEDEGGIQTGTSTGNREADDEIFNNIIQVSDNQTFRDAVDAYVATLDSARAMPPSPAAEEFRQAWIDAVTAVLQGDMEPEEALQRADQEAQSAIDAAGG